MNDKQNSVDHRKILDRAIEAAGGKTELARRLGVTRQAIYGWDRVPAERILAFVEATGMSRKQLRPDLFR